MLATRGWGREEFDLATGEFRAAVRFALFAERTTKLLDRLDEVTGMAVDHLDVRDKARVTRAQLSAREASNEIRAALLPEDDDVEGVQ